MSKPGYKTSEFWLALAAMLLGAFVTSGVLGPDHIAVRIAGVALTLLAGLGYGAGRAALKRVETAAASPPAGGVLADLIAGALSAGSPASSAPSSSSEPNRPS